MQNILIQQVKKAVLEVEPDAEIILYGSRSQGDSTPESDWDFLILTNNPVNFRRVEKIRQRLYEVELEYEEILSSIVRSRAEWHSSMYAGTPIYQNIQKQGIVL